MDAAQKTLANALPQIIWTCDAEGRLDWVNERWVELTGLTEEESLRDKGALVAVHPDDIGPRSSGSSRRALATSSPCEIEYRIRTREGAYRFHLCRVAPVRERGRRDHAAGWPRRSTCTTAGGRRRRCARRSGGSRRSFTSIRSRRRSRASSDGTYLSVNDAFLKMTGYTREEVVGKSTVELGIWTAGAARRRSSRPLLQAGRAEVDIPFRTKDGRRAHAGGRQRPHRLRRRALPDHGRDRRDGAPRGRGRACDRARRWPGRAPTSWRR